MSSSSISHLQAEQVPAPDRSFLLLSTNQKPEYKTHPHVLSGVIACGYCRDMGLPFSTAAMRQYTVPVDGSRIKGARCLPALKCYGGYKKGGDPKRHPIFALAEHRVAKQWNEYVARIIRMPVDAKHLALWRASVGSGAAEIAQVDQMEAAIREQRTLILIRLGNEWDEAVARQVRAALRDLDAQDQKLQALKKDAASRPAPVDETTLRNTLKRYAAVYESASPKEKNGLNRLLVGALGSMPSVKRLGELGKHPGVTAGAEVIFRWPEVDTILEAAAV